MAPIWIWFTQSDILCIFAQWFKPVLTQGVEAITLNHHDRRWRLFYTVRLSLHPVDSHTSEFKLCQHIIPIQNIMMIILTFYPHVSLVNMWTEFDLHAMPFYISRLMAPPSGRESYVHISTTANNDIWLTLGGGAVLYHRETVWVSQFFFR